MTQKSHLGSFLKTINCFKTQQNHVYGYCKDSKATGAPLWEAHTQTEGIPYPSWVPLFLLALRSKIHTKGSLINSNFSS